MRYDKISLLTALLVLSSTVSPLARTQNAPGKDAGQTALLETSLGYTYVHANAPPALCGCFSANGGYGSLAFNLPHGVSIVADLASVHANTVGATTQTITLFNYLFGPRYTFRGISRRFLPYGQVLGGREKEFSSYTTVQNVKGFAFSLGGGVNMPLNHHFSWNLFEADWVGARVPNGQNNIENDLRISSGVTLRFGHR
jgi:hypothetical protein